MTNPGFERAFDIARREFERMAKAESKPERSNYLSIRGEASFAGIRMLQSWADLAFYEILLNRYPVTGILEVGTGSAGLSWWFHFQAQMRGLTFFTFDTVQPDRPPPEFVQISQWSGVQGLIPGEPVFLFCDGEDRVWEANTLPQLCPPGSLIVIHDWLDQIQADEIPSSLREAEAQLCSQTGSMARAFLLDKQEQS